MNTHEHEAGNVERIADEIVTREWHQFSTVSKPAEFRRLLIEALTRLADENARLKAYIQEVNEAEPIRIERETNLRAELAKAKEDVERVNKLESMLDEENDLDVCKRDDGFHISQIFNQSLDAGPQPTLRAAIDSAKTEGAA